MVRSISRIALAVVALNLASKAVLANPIEDGLVQAGVAREVTEIPSLLAARSDELEARDEHSTELEARGRKVRLRNGKVWRCPRGRRGRKCRKARRKAMKARRKKCPKGRRGRRCRKQRKQRLDAWRKYDREHRRKRKGKRDLDSEDGIFAREEEIDSLIAREDVPQLVARGVIDSTLVTREETESLMARDEIGSDLEVREWEDVELEAREPRRKRKGRKRHGCRKGRKGRGCRRRKAKARKARKNRMRKAKKACKARGGRWRKGRCTRRNRPRSLVDENLNELD